MELNPIFYSLMKVIKNRKGKNSVKTEKLKEIYSKYKIDSQKFGAVGDRLGDVYEEYCVSILQDNKLLIQLKKGLQGNKDLEILRGILLSNKITDFNCIDYIEATTKVPYRETGGLPKTDIVCTVHYKERQVILTISCKQSTKPNVALAEFDVATICKEVGITDCNLIYLLNKHQTEMSAKNFSDMEKEELRRLLSPIKEKFVRWVLTGTTDEFPSDIRFPTTIIRFRIKRNTTWGAIAIVDYDMQDFLIKNVEEYISLKISKKGGFGTGLGWTYATGSRGKKIQFKG